MSPGAWGETISHDRIASNPEWALARNLRRERRPREGQCHHLCDRNSEAWSGQARLGQLSRAGSGKQREGGVPVMSRASRRRGRPWRGKSPGGHRPATYANPVRRWYGLLRGARPWSRRKFVSMLERADGQASRTARRHDPGEEHGWLLERERPWRESWKAYAGWNKPARPREEETAQRVRVPERGP